MQTDEQGSHNDEAGLNATVPPSIFLFELSFQLMGSCTDLPVECMVNCELTQSRLVNAGSRSLLLAAFMPFKSMRRAGSNKNTHKVQPSTLLAWHAMLAKNDRHRVAGTW